MHAAGGAALLIYYTIVLYMWLQCARVCVFIPWCCVIALPRGERERERGERVMSSHCLGARERERGERVTSSHYLGAGTRLFCHVDETHTS